MTIILNAGPPCPPVPGPPLSPRPGAPSVPPSRADPGPPAGRTPKVKNVFCFKFVAKSVPEALATTILILQKFSTVRAGELRRVEVRSSHFKSFQVTLVSVGKSLLSHW